MNLWITQGNPVAEAIYFAIGGALKMMWSPTARKGRVTMQYTIIALGVALAVLAISVGRAWSRRARTTEEGCRRDIAALRRTSRARGAARAHQRDVWLAGTDPEPVGSRAKKKVAWAAIGATGGACGGGGCGAGCGGGGCGGCGGCGG